MISDQSDTIFRTGKILLLILLSLSFASCEAQQNSEKINGVSFVASRKEITSEAFEPVLEINANSVAIMPFGFLESLESPHIRYNSERQWWGERPEGTAKTIQMAKSKGLSIMLKPQIWIWRGEFTGNIQMRSEKDWQTLENNYREFILLFAELAEEEKVEVFCIGTELNSFVETRPDFWKKLIRNVREIYSGKLTYAENWDKIQSVDFWKDLDYIGVDAYFPLSEKSSPDLDELKLGWQPYKKELKKLWKKHSAPILFTEYGYRNVDYTAKEPWNSSRDLKSINNENQVNALRALYGEIWDENWFAGGYLWKWHPDHSRAGGSENNQFTPQNKPAEKVVKEFYGRAVE